MILISSNNVSFYIRSKWTLRLPLCLTSLAVISWWSVLLAGEIHSNHWRLQGTSHNRCKVSHHTINRSNMQIKWKKKKTIPHFRNSFKTNNRKFEEKETISTPHIYMAAHKYIIIRRIVKPHYIIKTEISNSVLRTHLWNNLHHVGWNTKDLKAK